jgi:hypothetical protein
LDIARKIFAVLAGLFVIGVVIQFFLAGLGLLGGESMQAHIDFGWFPVHLFPILMLIVAAIARVGRTLLLMTLALAIVTFVQPFWVTEFEGEVLGALHILGALVMFGIAESLARRAMPLMRGSTSTTTVP